MKKLVAIAAVCLAGILVYSFIPISHTGTDAPFATKPGTKERLGERLFFDPILSATRTISCASCHIPAFGFADTAAFSLGVHGRRGKRNAPSCANLSDRPYFFYDGRAATLEDQIAFPIADTNEMGLPVLEAVKRLQRDKNYVQLFKAIFGEAPSKSNLQKALAAYLRTLETSHTPFDRYMDSDDTNAISASARRGRELFMGDKAKCFDCHFSPDLTGDEFRNIGLFDGRRFNDPGRYGISHDAGDIGKFKVPGLRNVAVTAPYMHNGMFRTLREVIDHYDDPYKTVAHPVNMDTLLQKPLGLTEQEKQDLEAFLNSLTDDRFRKL